MRVVDVIGGFLTLLVGLAAVSIVARPGNAIGQVIEAFGKAVSEDIGAAKN